MLGVAAAVMLGVANVSIKALVGTVPSDPLTAISPWTGVLVIAGVGAFFALARGLQIGGEISVIALSSVAANCASIGGGVVVFGDPIGADAVGIVLRSAAFVVVVGATALMPAPLGGTPRRPAVATAAGA